MANLLDGGSGGENKPRFRVERKSWRDRLDTVVRRIGANCEGMDTCSAREEHAAVLTREKQFWRDKSLAEEGP